MQFVRIIAALVHGFSFMCPVHGFTADLIEDGVRYFAMH